jgi:hypothetical protein
LGVRNMEFRTVNEKLIMFGLLNKSEGHEDKRDCRVFMISTMYLGRYLICIKIKYLL